MGAVGRVFISVMWVQLGGFSLVSCGCSWVVFVSVIWVQLLGFVTGCSGGFG